MADITFQQTIKVLAGKTPAQTNAAITEKDLEIPSEALTITEFNESTGHRFAVEDGAVDQSLCQGTIETIQVLVIRVEETDLNLKLVNTNGTSQSLLLKADRLSIWHGELTDVLMTNSSGSTIKGLFFVAGID